MRFLRFFVVLLFVLTARSVYADTCPLANVNLSNGWTLIDCNANGTLTCCALTVGLSHAQAIAVHDTVVVFCDSSATAKVTGFNLVGVSDNLGNTYHRIPSLIEALVLGESGPVTALPTLPAIALTDGVGAAEDLSYWVLYDNQTASGSPTFTCTSVQFSGATFKDIDISVMVFRHSSGHASTTAVSLIPWQNGRTTTGGTCPCIAVSGGTTLNLAYPGSLIIAGGNMNDGPTQIDSPFVGCDGRNDVSVFVAFYNFCATVPTTTDVTATTYSFKWYDRIANDIFSNGAIAILPPDIQQTRMMGGVGR